VKRVIVDSKALCYRLFYADPKRDLGNNVRRSLEKLRKRCEPCELVLAWDGWGVCFRNDIYPDYKQGRKPTPSAMKAAVLSARQEFARDGLPQVAVDHYEADDVMASFAKQASRHDQKGSQVAQVAFRHPPQVRQILIGHLRQSDLGDVELGALDQLEQQVERPFVDRKADGVGCHPGSEDERQDDPRRQSRHQREHQPGEQHRPSFAGRGLHRQAAFGLQAAPVGLEQRAEPFFRRSILGLADLGGALSVLLEPARLSRRRRCAEHTRHARQGLAAIGAGLRADGVSSSARRAHADGHGKSTLVSRFRGSKMKPPALAEDGDGSDWPG